MKTTALIALAFVALLSERAYADDKAKAEAHFRSAEAHFQSKNFREAIDGYADSYKLFPAPILLFNIARCHEELGEKQKAVDKFREYIKAEPGGDRVAEATTRASNLEQLVATEKAAAEASKRAAIAEKRAAVAGLRAEGKHAELAVALGELYELEPDAELIYDIAMAREQAGETDLAITEYDRYLATEAPKRGDEATSRRDALKKAGGGNGNGIGIGTGPVTRPDSGPSIVWPVAGSVVTVGFLGASLVMGAIATATFNELNDEFESVDPPVDNSDPRIEDGRGQMNTANILLLGGVVAAGVTGYLWIRYIGKKREAQQTSIGVVPTRGGANAVVGVRF